MTRVHSGGAVPGEVTAPVGSLAWLAGRRSELLPFTVVGTLSIIAGGLVAAVTAPAPSEHGTWSAAYLVLVAGVAQIGLGLGQAMFTSRRTRPPIVAAQAAGWNVGNAAVISGTLLGALALVDIGGVMLVITLGLMARGLAPAGAQPLRGVRRLGLYGYRILVLILLVSIPVGLVLARLRG